jgi:hypothetical protein
VGFLCSHTLRTLQHMGMRSLDRAFRHPRTKLVSPSALWSGKEQGPEKENSGLCGASSETGRRARPRGAARPAPWRRYWSR